MPHLDPNVRICKIDLNMANIFIGLRTYSKGNEFLYEYWLVLLHKIQTVIDDLSGGETMTNLTEAFFDQLL